MKSRKRHIILFLFDSKMGETQTCQMESYLKKIKKPANSEIDIYYLKIMPVDRRSENHFQDTVSQVIFYNGANELQSLGKHNYNLRSEEGLRNCFENIRNTSLTETFYLVSFGHGNGIYIDKKYVPDALILEKSKNDKVVFDGREYIAIIPEFQDDSVVWQNEALWNMELSKACNSIKPEVAVFNNCYVNFFDSLVFYSRSFKYIIGSERYQCPSMLVLDKLIDTIIDAAELEEKERILKIYDTVLDGVEKGRKAIGACKHPSLVLLKLDGIEKVNSSLKALFSVWMQSADFSEESFKKLQKELYVYYLIKDYCQIELFVLLNGISKVFSNADFAGKSEYIKSFLMKEIVLRYKSFPDLEDASSGISMYLPLKGIDQFHGNLFLEYRTKMREWGIELADQFAWYVLLDKMEKIQAGGS